MSHSSTGLHCEFQTVRSRKLDAALATILSVMSGAGDDPDLHPEERLAFIGNLQILINRYRYEQLGNTLARTFISHGHDMRISPAWQCLPDQARRILDRLELAHMDLGGSRNGALQVSYRHFIEAGLPNKRSVARAINQCEALGFLNAKHGSLGESSLYFLTYIPGRRDSLIPTDAWKRIKTPSAAQALLREIG
jgi:hypothetical protein